VLIFGSTATPDWLAFTGMVAVTVLFCPLITDTIWKALAV
jgi:hypothetical protein